MNAKWETPWWTWVQFIDLALHSIYFPTLGRDLVAAAEIRLFDKDYELINSWTVNYTKSYVGNIWWSVEHGGAYDIVSDVEIQAKVIKYAFDNIKTDLAKKALAYISRAKTQK